MKLHTILAILVIVALLIGEYAEAQNIAEQLAKAQEKFNLRFRTSKSSSNSALNMKLRSEFKWEDDERHDKLTSPGSQGRHEKLEKPDRHDTYQRRSQEVSCGFEGHLEEELIAKLHQTSQLLRFDDFIQDTQITSVHRREATEFKPIRILADTTFVQSDEQRCLSENQVIQLAPTTSYTCQASDVIDSTIISLIINHVIPDAVSILESIIRVSGPETTLFPSFMFDAGWRTCGEAKIPIPLEFFEGKGDGINADYWMAVSARPFVSTQTLATSAPCMFLVNKQTFGRPLAAGINLAPRFLRNLLVGSYDYEEYVRVLLHEVFHGLGMSSFTLAPESGFGLDRYVETSLERGDIVTRFTGPRVTSFARAHFNCSTLSGFELENNGGTGTAGSHWKQRVAGDEFMSGYPSLLGESRLSNLSLAFLEDIGFYQVDYSKAEVMLWGKDFGCDFALQRCDKSLSWRLPGYFCSRSGTRSCTFDRGSIGECIIGQWSTNLPSQYQYFDSPNIGDVVVTDPLVFQATLDYCPVILPYANTQCQDPNEVASPVQMNGPTSYCFEFEDFTTKFGCFNTSCEDDKLFIYVVDGWKRCGDGNKVTDSLRTISVTCPSASERFCQRRNPVSLIFSSSAPSLTLPMLSLFIRAFCAIYFAIIGLL